MDLEDLAHSEKPSLKAEEEAQKLKDEEYYS
jgi:hypothetical protein